MSEAMARTKVQQILALAASGLSSPEIAARVGCTRLYVNSVKYTTRKRAEAGTAAAARTQPARKRRHADLPVAPSDWMKPLSRAQLMSGKA